MDRKHDRELVLASVAGSTGFTIQSTLALNPGLAATFPRLSIEAALWQQYRFVRLVFYWVPFAPTSIAGDMMLSPNYDASQPAPMTETQASDNYGTTVANVFMPFSCELDPDAMMGAGPRRWVRTGNLAGDIKTFDVGKLFVVSNNESGASAVGKLYVEYDVEFFGPQNSPVDASVASQTSFYLLNANQTITNATPTAIAWDTIGVDALGFGAPAAGVFTPAAGAYRVFVQASCADSSAEAFGVVLTLYKNGAALTKSIGSSMGDATSIGAGQSFVVSCVGVVVFNGTDTFQVEIQLNGAAGTLTVTGGRAQLLLELA